MLERFSKRPPDSYRGVDGAITFYTAAYSSALERDVVGVCRSLVTAMRASGARRLGLWQYILYLNTCRAFPQPIPLLRLLRDCETRWSSTYIMIQRVRCLWPV